MSDGGRRVQVEGVEVPTDHFIDGRRVGGEARFEVRSPIDWDGWELAAVAAGGAAEVDLAVAAARRAFPRWAALGPAGRREHLRAFADAIDAAVPALAAVECADNGSLLEAMRERVLPRAATNIRFFADFASERLEQPPRVLAGGERNRVRYDPCGVVAVSTPWNAPLMLATWRVGPALAAGNTVVLKPPEWAPLTCSMLGDLAAAAGLPAGVLNIVHGSGADAGAPLTGHRDVDRVAFTGSPLTARTVYRDAAAALTPVSFELGGKSPFLVFADCDLDAAAATAAYQYDNAGQVCLAGTRLLVEQTVYEPFLERLRERVDAIVVGDPRLADTTYGPLIHPVALERVTARVARAREDGARLAVRRGVARRAVLAADAVHRRPAGRRDPAHRGLRAGADAAGLRRRGAGDRDGQRQRLRPGGDGVHRLGRALGARQRRARRRYRVGQLLLRARPGDAVRRGARIGHRPRRRPLFI